MNFALALFVVVGFAATIEWLGLPNRAREVGRRSTRSLEVVRNGSLSDQEKEQILQQQSGESFWLLGLLVGGSALAIGGPLAVVWGLRKMGIGSFSGTIDVLERLYFLVGVTVAGGLGYVLYRRFSD